MNALLAPPEFLLAEQYASAVTTLGAALCWAPVLPVSPLLAALGALLDAQAVGAVAASQQACRCGGAGPGSCGT